MRLLDFDFQGRSKVSWKRRFLQWKKFFESYNLIKGEPMKMLIVLCFVLFGSKSFAQNITDWETVAASQSDQVCGTTGTRGDVIDKLVIVPATTAAGNVSIKDGGGSAISVFATGTLSDLRPIVIPLGMKSLAGGWKVTTGANVSAICIGRFR